jgi:hypothetical protein
MAEVATEEETVIENVENTTALSESPVVDAETNTNTDAPATEIIPEETAAESAAIEPVITELTEDQVTAFLRKQGILTEDAKLDALKPKVEPDPIQLTMAEIAKERAIEDRHVASGKPKEELIAFKVLAKANPIEVAIEVEKQNLIENNYTKDQADAIIKQTYGIYSDEEIEDMELDEDEVKNLKNKNLAFAKTLQAKGNFFINNAKNYLANLQNEIDTESYEKQVDADISATVESAAKNLPRKITVAITELAQGVGLESFEVELDESVISNVAKTLSDKSARKEILFNKNGSEKADYLLELMAIKENLPKFLEQAFLGNARKPYSIAAKFYE